MWCPGYLTQPKSIHFLDITRVYFSYIQRPDPLSKDPLLHVCQISNVNLSLLMHVCIVLQAVVELKTAFICRNILFYGLSKSKRSGGQPTEQYISKSIGKQFRSHCLSKSRDKWSSTSNRDRHSYWRVHKFHVIMSQRVNNEAVDDIAWFWETCCQDVGYFIFFWLKHLKLTTFALYRSVLKPDEFIRKQQRKI